MLRQGKVYLITALLSAGILITMMVSGVFRHWRESLIDFLYTARQAPPHTLIIEIDEPTISSIGQWPIPRSVYGNLVSKMSEADAAVLGIDINFKEPSQNPAEDASFVAAIRQSQMPVVLTAEIQPDGKILHPVGQLDRLARQGFPNIFTSSDGVVRSTRFRVQEFPSLALTLAAAYRESFPDAEFIIPDNATRIAYPGPARTYPFISAVEVLENKIPASFFKDRIVLIGATAKDLQDYHKTPLGLMSGVEIQAAITSTLIDKYFYTNLQALSLVLIGLFSLIVAACAMYFKRPSFFVATLFGLVLLYTIIVFILFDQRYILDLLYPNLAFIFTGAMVITAQYSVTAREKKYIHDTFSRYLAPQVIKELIDNPEALKLGGKKENLSILFSDIRNFTSLSETMSAEQLTSFLNQYLNRMTRVVLDHEGVIDKYIGDAIMAFWGAPLPNHNHAYDSITSALEMVDALAAFNRRNERLKNPVISVGIGINSGEVTVGNMGSERRFDYTVIGDNVNLASRLEGLTKAYGVSIIVGESTYEATREYKNFLFRELDRVQVKGKKQRVRIFQVIPKHEQARMSVILQPFADALDSYYRGAWGDAVELFSDILDKMPGDGPSLLIRERCVLFIKRPPENWEGVYEHTDK